MIFRIQLATLLSSVILIADSEGPNNPSADSGGWSSSTSNAYTQSDTYANTGVDGDIQTYTGFGFSIPSGATIDGVTVEYDAFKTGTRNNTFRFNLVNVGTCTSKETGVLATSDTDTYGTEGGTSDTWSCTSLTVTNVNSSSFGISVELDRAGGPAPASLSWTPDHFRVTVEYTPAATGRSRMMFVGGDD